MSKRSKRGISKKGLPRDLRRITIDKERWWIVGDNKFKTLREVQAQFGKK